MRKNDPLGLSVYMDVHKQIAKCWLGYGCKLVQRFVGCLLYADDIVLRAHSLNAKNMWWICNRIWYEV